MWTEGNALKTWKNISHDCNSKKVSCRNIEKLKVLLLGMSLKHNFQMKFSKSRYIESGTGQHDRFISHKLHHANYLHIHPRIGNG